MAHDADLRTCPCMQYIHLELCQLNKHREILPPENPAGSKPLRPICHYHNHAIYSVNAHHHFTCHVHCMSKLIPNNQRCHRNHGTCPTWIQPLIFSSGGKHFNNNSLDSDMADDSHTYKHTVNATIWYSWIIWLILQGTILQNSYLHDTYCKENFMYL